MNTLPGLTRLLPLKICDGGQRIEDELVTITTSMLNSSLSFPSHADMHCPRSVQPLSLLQHTIRFSESYFSRALAKTWACHSALKPPGTFVPDHMTTMSTSLFSAEALLKKFSCSIPLSLAAWTAPSTDRSSGSIAADTAAVRWCEMSGTSTREPRIASTWCRQFTGESGRKSYSGAARMHQHHQLNPIPSSLKVRFKAPRYDHSVALSVMQSLMNKSGGMAGESEEEVVERVNGELEGLGTFVSDKMLWQLVKDSSLAPALVPPVTAWAVSQPGWRDEQQLYINLIDFVGMNEHKDATMAVCRLAMSREGVLDNQFLDRTSRYLLKWRLHKEVFELFTVLGQQGFQASHKQYTVLLGIFGQKRDLEGALEVLESMKRIGISPDTRHYTVVLELCGKRRRLEQLERVVMEMRRAGIQPDNVTYNTMIHSYGMLNEPQRAGEVFKEMLRGGILPTAKTFGAYHAILTRGGWLRDAERLLDMVQKRTDLIRDAGYYRLLMDGYSTSLNADKLIEAHREMVRAGVALDVRTYKKVFHCLCQKYEAQVYHQFFLEVLAQGRVELGNNIYSLVCRTLLRDGLVKEAERVREQASNRGQVAEALGGEMHNKIEDLLGGRKYGELKDVLREMRKDMGVVPFWVYLMLLGKEKGRWEEKEKEDMLEILDACEYETTKIVRLLLDEKRNDAEVWQNALKLLEGM